MYWAQLLLQRPGEPPVIILSREGVTQRDPLSIVLYGITLITLYEELRAADPGILSPFYADDAAFDGLAQRSAQLLKLLMKRGTDRGTSLRQLSPSSSRPLQGKRRRQSGNFL